MSTIAQDDPMAPGTTFVHDFAGVNQSLEQVLAAVPRLLTTDAVRAAVLHAWSDEATALADARDVGTAGLDTGAVATDATLRVDTGVPRARRDAMIVPISWSGAEGAGLPPIEADLEFTAFGDDRTHVHLFGRSTVNDAAGSGSRRGSLASSIAVAVVRRFLGELVVAFESAPTGPPAGSSTS